MHDFTSKIILNGIIIAIYAVFYKYLEDLKQKDCQCAIKKNLKFMQQLIIVWFALEGFIILLHLVMMNTKIKGLSSLLLVVYIIKFFLFITLAHVFLKYDGELRNSAEKDDKCRECIKSKARIIFRWYIILSLISMFVQLLVFIVIFRLVELDLVDTNPKPPAHIYKIEI